MGERLKAWKFRYQRTSSTIIIIKLNFLASPPNTTKDDKFEETIIEACTDVNSNVSETDIEACHRLPVRYNATNVSKRVIVKFVNQKHAGSILSKKFTLSSTDFSRFNINNEVYVNLSLCPYYC